MVLVMNKRKNNLQMTEEEYMDTMVDYAALIIDMVQKMDRSDYKFLKQIYTIIYRHTKKRGR